MAANKDGRGVPQMNEYCMKAVCAGRGQTCLVVLQRQCFHELSTFLFLSTEARATEVCLSIFQPFPNVSPRLCLCAHSGIASPGQ